MAFGRGVIRTSCKAHAESTTSRGYPGLRTFELCDADGLVDALFAMKTPTLQLFQMSYREQHREDQQRRHGRVVCQDIDCTLGEILDISASGMRVRCGSKPPPLGFEFTTKVDGLDGEITFSGVVVWTRRCGFLRFEAGIEFRNLTEAMRKTLATLARAGAQNESFRNVA